MVAAKMVMFGCATRTTMPKGVTLWGDGEDVGGQWVEGRGLLGDYRHGKGPRAEAANDGAMVGFMMLQGDAAAERKARLMWPHFAAHCRALGVTLAEPVMVVVCVEVA